MPLGVKPKCHLCKITFSVMWRKNDNGEVICNTCSIRPPSSHSRRSSCPFNLRKSTRAKSSRFRQSKSQQIFKAKSRRTLVFKKNAPQKAPSIPACIKTSDMLFYDNHYYQIGDIVSLENGHLFYLQIRGLAYDENGRKSAYLDWLLPSSRSVKDYFDPNSYIHGPEDLLPRQMEYLKFVCHAPPEFYKLRVSPYPLKPSKYEKGFVWTSIGPRIVRFPSRTEVFGTGNNEGEDSDNESVRVVKP